MLSIYVLFFHKTQRYLYRKGSSFTFLAFNTKLTVMHEYNALRNAKSKAGTARFSCTPLINTVKTVKDILNTALRYANS